MNGDYSRTHANRLIGAAEVVAVLAPIGAKIEGESQVRPLLGLALDDVPAAWKKAQEMAENGKITAKHVKSAVIELHWHAKPPTRGNRSETG